MNEVVLMSIIGIMILASVCYGVFMAINEDIEREKSSHIYSGDCRDKGDEDDEV